MNIYFIYFSYLFIYFVGVAFAYEKLFSLRCGYRFCLGCLVWFGWLFGLFCLVGWFGLFGWLVVLFGWLVVLFGLFTWFVCLAFSSICSYLVDFGHLIRLVAAG